MFQSHSSGERSGLTAIRNAAAVLSNITVYGVAWLFLGIRERAEGDEQVSDLKKHFLFVTDEVAK